MNRAEFPGGAELRVEDGQLVAVPNLSEQHLAPTHPRFMFIREGRLQEAPIVRDLVRSLDPVTADTHCETVMQRFLADDALYGLPVIDPSEKPRALIDRKHYIEFFSKPYTREIFRRRSIVDLLAHADFRATSAVVVEDYCNVEDVAKIIIDAGMNHMVTGFIVTKSGRYLGVANGHDLLHVITQRKQAELYYLAHYDSLVGIPNRTLLTDRLVQACHEADRRGVHVAVLFIDVDRFKQINDSLGHSMGDLVLRKVVQKLKAQVRKIDTLARLSGDEFVILMHEVASAEDADRMAERIVHSMREPITLPGHSIVVGVSIGAAIYPTDDADVGTLLSKADAAMYEAKLEGRNTYRRFSPDTSLYNPTRMLFENELRKAIDRNELELWFQPQIEFGSGKVQGVEALVRWRHTTRGLIPPGEFIPVAEESGLIIPLGNWVVSRAVKQLSQWRCHACTELKMAINISALQFKQRSFPAFLKNCIDESGIDPTAIELELTESALMQDADDVLPVLSEIKQIGVRLAIDDFGTGFSSLSYLRRFPLDRLKIDQSFVREIQSIPVNESIARAIVALAKSLSLDIIAEGIETESEKQVIELLGCTTGQGYLFARPLPSDDLCSWLESDGGPAAVSINARSSSK